MYGIGQIVAQAEARLVHGARAAECVGFATHTAPRQVNMDVAMNHRDICKYNSHNEVPLPIMMSHVSAWFAVDDRLVDDFFTEALDQAADQLGRNPSPEAVRARNAIAVAKAFRAALPAGANNLAMALRIGAFVAGFSGDDLILLVGGAASAAAVTSVLGPGLPAVIGPQLVAAGLLAGVIDATARHAPALVGAGDGHIVGTSMAITLLSEAARGAIQQDDANALNELRNRTVEYIIKMSLEGARGENAGPVPST
jgi:hypothetical protein